MTGLGAEAQASWMLGGRLRAGTLEIVLPNQRVLRLSGRNAGPSAVLRLNRWRALRRFFGGGTVGFGESYMDGDWESPDLPKVIELAARNLPERPMTFRTLSPWRMGDRIRHVFRPNTRDGSRENIAAHYDLGNEFYALWLDPSMTYSSAVFGDGANDLESAQAVKNRRLMDLAGIRPGDRGLEIGCGWGGFALQEARERGAHVTALTVSRAQFDEARRRVMAAGLGEKVDIRLCDYRDLDGDWDHAVSVEMIEAVGEKYWPVYFDRVASCIRPGGTFALQAIVIENARFDAYRRSADFIQKHIFPGSLLLSISRMNEAFQSTGDLFLYELEDLGLSYARTLSEWYGQFNDKTDAVRELGFSERFIRKWNYYLKYCEAAFATRNISVVQAVYTRPCNPRLT